MPHHVSTADHSTGPLTIESSPANRRVVGTRHRNQNQSPSGTPIPAGITCLFTLERLAPRHAFGVALLKHSKSGANRSASRKHKTRQLIELTGFCWLREEDLNL